MRRSLRHVRVAAASLVAVFSLLSACAGSPPPSGSDPLQGASTRSTLPSNVGPADCDPPSTTREVDLGLEAEAATLQGEIWALFASRAPLRAGQELVVWWHIPGTTALQIVLVGAGDREVVIEKSATLRIVMEEWSLENLRMALMGGTAADDGSSHCASD